MEEVERCDFLEEAREAVVWEGAHEEVACWEVVQPEYWEEVLEEAWVEDLETRESREMKRRWPFLRGGPRVLEMLRMPRVMLLRRTGGGG